ncbi:cobalt-precorrin-6A reductase [Clostridium sp. MSJ-11]|uniref:Cobalt-precorrin-6A reductase n=1 Tax=Clostridium mobile TaxID=2841512 RepID=A0ABS6EK64_9CLOT|nr:cobalt-precorrin-6A reductase [Clostridium mobile]MBU5485603.1 cobalt-precorrin-6A reductase [Clostridium mobile]
MIGLISGTSEGKEILGLLNEYTDDIFVSTATEYGGELLKDYKYKILNNKPLNKEEMIETFSRNKINILIDATHPYAIDVSKNLIDVCKKLSVEYIRFERESVVDKFRKCKKVVLVEDYSELYEKLKDIDGNILNTTGSRNLDKILNLGVENRIIHRVLPSLKVMEECYSLGIKLDDLIAIKGPVNYDLNRAFIKNYNAKAIIMKDSGTEGGTEEKIKSALDEGIWVIIIDREKLNYKNLYKNKEELMKHLFN